MSSTPSPLIVLDGPDGSGTTFHSTHLAKCLRTEGHSVCLTAEPSAGPIGQCIREYLQSKDIDAAALQLLFTADRADHIARTIVPSLTHGDIVVCDRYIPSTIAYGAAQFLSKEWLKNLNNNFILPSMTILLLPPIDCSLARLSQRRSQDMLEDESLQRRVHEAYRHIAADDPRIVVIDSSGTKDDVAENIWSAVKGILSCYA